MQPLAAVAFGGFLPEPLLAFRKFAAAASLNAGRPGKSVEGGGCVVLGNLLAVQVTKARPLPPSFS